MPIQNNPFHDLYLGENVSEERFIDVFSPFLVPHALPLYQPGNVLLLGVQGSGKSMLLHLLKPEVRIAYARRNGVGFPPADSGMGDFIGAGINIIRSPAIDFGQRRIESTDETERDVLPLYFGDFVNYWLIEDLLSSISKLWQAQAQGLDVGLVVNGDPKRLDAVASRLSREPTFSGYFEGDSSYDRMYVKLRKRLDTYRDFFKYNIDSFPAEVKATKSSVGQAISRVVDVLRETEVIGADTAVIMRIDQCDDILRVQPGSEKGRVAFRGFREIINKMIGLRDPNVSYRIAARPSSWPGEPRIYGTDSPVEHYRNYKVLDIDELLRRGENSSTYLFQKFAEEVFRKRLDLSGFALTGTKDCLRAVLGSGMKPGDEAKRYAKGGERIIDRADLPEAVFALLDDLAHRDPLGAKLSEAWTRQQLKRPNPVLPTLDDPQPWMKKPYWQKERTQQALLQIAARRGQRLVWSGTDDVVLLSGVNILAFLSLCQVIWDRWMRSNRERNSPYESSKPPAIDDHLQTEGIQSASTNWWRKLGKETGSDVLMPFVDVVGKLLRKGLRDDTHMSYPGANGFSLTNDGLRSYPQLADFLANAADFGVLVELPHQTKNSDGRPRTKYYVVPVLCPHYQIPAARTKEPLYVEPEQVMAWLSTSQPNGAGLLSTLEREDLPAVPASSPQRTQRSLFEVEVEA